MRSHARIVVALRRGVLHVDELRSAPPITLRRTGANDITIVSSAAWPVGGDSFRLDVTVAPGATLNVTSVAASLAHPSPGGAQSTFSLDVDIAEGASFRWLPEPTVLVEACDHATSSTVRIAADAALAWREEVRLGRWNEPSGSLVQRTSIERDGRPLLRNELALGPAWPGSSSTAAVGAQHVALGSAIRVGNAGGASGSHIHPEVAWAEHPIATDATSWIVLGTRMSAMRSTLAALLGDDRSSERGSLTH